LFGLGDLLEQGCGLAAADGSQPLALGWSGTEGQLPFVPAGLQRQVEERARKFSPCASGTGKQAGAAADFAA
jgi:hypothetical protein